MKLTRCKISKKVQLKLLEFFVAEVTARTAADLVGIHHNSAALFYHKIRLVIEYHLNFEAEIEFDGEIELDESYFGGTRKGKRGRGAGVFGILKRKDRVYTVIVKDTKQNTLMPIIKSKIKPDSIYNALDVSDFKHFRINHSKEFANNHNHRGSIENFCPQSKRILRKYNGIDKKHFHLFLKDEKHYFARFRFNYGTPSEKLRVLRKWRDV